MNHGELLKMGEYNHLSIEGCSPDIIRCLYRFMLRLRRCQEALIKEYYPADEMRCPVHFCIGQEASPAALSLLLSQSDYLLSHHRCHGYYLAKGGSMNALFAEIYGRATGANGGIAGSQDISVHDLNFFSGAILSGSVAIAVGVALGFQTKALRSVAVTAFGDGATDQGIFWEAINYAVLRRLPLVFVCENNRYSTYAPLSKRQGKENISERVQSFGMNVKTVFGNDVALLYSVFSNAIEEAREGRGPCFIEAFTYRWNAHVGPGEDDYLGYRSVAEREFWKKNCPIALLEKQMVGQNLMDSKIKEKMIVEIDQEIATAFQFAKESPFPHLKEWSQLNYNIDTPQADRLLETIDSSFFDQNQKEAMPGPY
ncbi:MAG: hypothetical protein A3F82_02105 [Deltaproteobacteria bacterium RIFCSPLOWO2_12_FULL_44_12]|nr:MAG: hypothetical protein A2712_02850 [Deltaproteobacteria bacterium RIFCSPHIGHO2_01_FULL_43_49]OGQ16134.1 MAG: hypothetical protein A3D22_00820 [Deltaproteobacteria bacterium RIFCSPHIGHO2_02_FULL_44_53]OGQ29095.1 MAG: hypothetical protein A3D98_04605 [Deltaproteobacteria bacterium RIFCSPHIGHO2_12_FULL_44_21]OGQ32651.1 MAG: hypothetical protein A2979_08750 [Deltaproteobacteria bacterium RIFCSPLOWO2_01_FULL_45_74]OGQ41752.1 MAG: hypothetical protein A3I70_08535 [Deltaproteobacteria bacterium 